MAIARMLCALVVAVTVAGCDTDTSISRMSSAVSSAAARIASTTRSERGTLGAVTVGGRLESKIGGGNDQLATTAVGTLLGPYQGSEIGRSLDRADRRYAEGAAEKSLATSPAGRTSRWSNPDTGHAGTFTPTNTYRSDDGLRCRDYNQSITIDERSHDAYGTACLADDGSWRIVETPVRRALRRRR